MSEYPAESVLRASETTTAEDVDVNTVGWLVARLDRMAYDLHDSFSLVEKRLGEVTRNVALPGVGELAALGDSESSATVSNLRATLRRLEELDTRMGQFRSLVDL